MLLSSIKATSAYERTMRNAVNDLYAEGVLEFRAEYLANRMGRKVTHAFRGYLAQLVGDGTLERYRYFTEAGGQGIGYRFPEIAGGGQPF